MWLRSYYGDPDVIKSSEKITLFTLNFRKFCSKLLPALSTKPAKWSELDGMHSQLIFLWEIFSFWRRIEKLFHDLVLKKPGLWIRVELTFFIELRRAKIAIMSISLVLSFSGSILFRVKSNHSSGVNTWIRVTASSQNKYWHPVHDLSTFGK